MPILPGRKMPAAGLMVLTMTAAVALGAPETAVFQQGLNDYTGTVDLRLRNQDTLAGSGRATNDADGGDTALGDALYALVFIRFDGVFGTGPGQVPYGSQIVAASLDVMTNISSNAQSGNVFTVAALQAPLLSPEAGTIFAAYSNGAGYGGPDFPDNHTFRPGNAFRSVEVPVLTHNQGEKSFCDITETVRYWAGGSDLDPRNHGLVIADVNGTDGWGMASTGNATPEFRPALRISYYPPAVATAREARTLVLQQGLYDAESNTTWDKCVSVWLPDTVSPVNAANFAALSVRTPSDGVSLAGPQYLDGTNAAADSPDDQMIIQFKDLFGAGPGQIELRPTLRIERAVLRLTSGPSGNATSPGPVDVHRMLRPWYTEDEFGNRTFQPFTAFTAPGAPAGTIGNGPNEANGYTGPLEDSFWGMWLNQVNEANVTASVRAWAAGAPNYGLSIQQSTADGWQVHFPGASLAVARPQLVITYSYDPDADNDGLPDEWETANQTNPAVPDAGEDPDLDTLTNLQEYTRGTKPKTADTDADGYRDDAEDGTGIWVSPQKTGTSPVLADTDLDGLPDGAENPTLPFTGVAQAGSDPNKVDSDGDGSPDHAEVLFAGNPVSAAVLPVISFTPVMSDDFDNPPLNSLPNYLSSSGTFLPQVLDSGVPANAQALELTNSTANSNTSAAWNAVPAKGNAVRLSFDYRMSADVGAAEAADGFGIGLFRTSLYGTVDGLNPGAAPRAWEDPRVGGGFADALFLGFDIYNGTTEGNNVRLTGPGSSLALINKVVPVPLNNGLFNRVVLTLTSGGAGAAVSRLDLVSDINGAAPVTVNLWNNLVIPGWNLNAEEYRLITGGRTGTSLVTTDFDNLALSVAGSAPPVLPAFDLTGVSRNPATGALTLDWASVAGGKYRIQSSAALGQWSDVGDPVTATGSASSITLPVPAGNPLKMYYRVKRTE